MQYNDLLDGTYEEACADIMSHLDCTSATATEILANARNAHARGLMGQPYLAARLDTGVDSRDLARLLQDAWHEGIVSKDRVTIHLSTETDGCCGECGRCVAYYTNVCSYCGGSDIERKVMVTIRAPYANVWADHDQTIDGTMWEADDDFVYTILTNRDDLVSELRDEGYVLDLSNYDEDLV